jgi:hypothetical protein
MVMSQDQNAGQNGNTETGNKSFETVNSLNISEQPQRIKIPFMKKLRAN